MNADEAHDYLFRFFGYGNPASPLWFVGIEEGGDPGQPPKTEAHSSLTLDGDALFYDPELPKQERGERRPLWAKYRDISHRADNGDGYFMSNMAPLARPSVAHPLNGVSWPVYRQRVIQERIPMLRALILAFRPKAVLVHGAGAWRTYMVREAFDLPLPAGRIQSFPDRGLVFTNFLLRGFPNTDRDAVVAVLRQWLTR
jgi:hypothetical protein